MKVVIFTRRGSGDCYVASAPGTGVSASSTSDPKTAVERVALKLKLKRKDVTSLRSDRFGITVKCVTKSQYYAQWEDEEAGSPIE